MAQINTDNLLTGAELSRALGIPKHAIYRLAARGKIPCVDATEVWHDHKQLRFDVEAVRAALAQRRRAS